MARKKAVIDWNTVTEHLRAGCSGSAIASKLGIHENTLYTRCKQDQKVEFVAFAQQKRREGDDLLHLTQFQTALSGNVSMLIWLGKNRLGQSDKSNVEIGGTLETLLITPKADDSE